MVCCLSTGIIRPIFYSETTTAERYQELIMNLISLFEVDEQYCWFQQDGATAHTANSTMQMLSEFFGGRIIVAPSISGSIATRFLSLGVLEGEKTTRTHQKNLNKILSCAFQTSLQKLFTGLHQT
jgi:hypothetical protein